MASGLVPKMTMTLGRPGPVFVRLMFVSVRGVPRRQRVLPYQVQVGVIVWQVRIHGVSGSVVRQRQTQGGSSSAPFQFLEQTPDALLVARRAVPPGPR